MNTVLRYFDLNRDLKRSQLRGTEAGGALDKKVHWLWQWLSLFAGILLQPFLEHYRQTGSWAWDTLAGWTVFALITAVVVFPSVYRAAFDPSKPVVLLLAPIFTAGLGWEALFGTAVKAAGG